MASHTLPAARPGGDALALLTSRRRRTRHPFYLSRRQRHRIEALIERLIATLDAADGDCDREPEPDEDDDFEGSLVPPVSPDSTRPTAPAVWL